MSLTDKGYYSGIEFVKEVQAAEGFKDKKKQLYRGYKEGLYYAKLALLGVIISSVITTIGVVGYLNMPGETYYTTDYAGEIRELTPYHVQPR